MNRGTAAPVVLLAIALLAGCGQGHAGGPAGGGGGTGGAVPDACKVVTAGDVQSVVGVAPVNDHTLTNIYGTKSQCGYHVTPSSSDIGYGVAVEVVIASSHEDAMGQASSAVQQLGGGQAKSDLGDAAWTTMAGEGVFAVKGRKLLWVWIIGQPQDGPSMVDKLTRMGLARL
jgi:hypothetical protein